MYLINTETLELCEFANIYDRRYAILSHRWEGEEVTFQEFWKKSAVTVAKEGYKKIENFCALAKTEGLSWAWVDTCCIDKKSSADLSEAINSMWDWYTIAQKCYVYLSDVSYIDDRQALLSSFESSEWFRRGWTLQELLAPIR